MDTLKRIQKIIRESAFDNRKKKTALTFNPGLVLTGVRTTGPRVPEGLFFLLLAAKMDQRCRDRDELFFSPLVTIEASPLNFPRKQQGKKSLWHPGYEGMWKMQWSTLQVKMQNP